MAKKQEAAFTTTGFNNWKNAAEAFMKHEACVGHMDGVTKNNQPAADSLIL